MTDCDVHIIIMMTKYYIIVRMTECVAYAVTIVIKT